jgi:hypothetical protein
MTANNLAKIMGYGLVLWLTLRGTSQPVPTQVKTTNAYQDGIELDRQ